MVTKPLIPLNTIDEVVAAFGATKDLAEWCGIGPSNISDWKADGRIPNGWHYRLDREARRRGYLINPALFGDRPEPAEAIILERVRAS